MADNKIEQPKIEAVVNFAPQPAAPALAELYPVIIGPAYMLEKGFLGGPYDPVFGITFSIPSGNNLQFDANYLKIYIASDSFSYKLPYTIFEGSGTINGTLLTISGMLYEPAPGDVVKITDPVVGHGEYIVTTVSGANGNYDLTLSGTPPSGPVYCQVNIHKPQVNDLVVVIPPRTKSNSISYLETMQISGTTSLVSGIGFPISGATWVAINSISDWELLGLPSGTPGPVYFKVIGVSGNYNMIQHLPAISSGSTTSISGNIYAPYSSSLVGNVLADYRFLRTNKGIFVVTNVDDIETIIGKPDVDNPLALGLKIALDNAGTAVYGIAIDSNDDAGYNNVQDYIKQYNVYSIVPLTIDSSVLLSYASLVNAMNDPLISKPRMLIATRGFLEYKTIVQEGYATINSTGYLSSVLTYTDPLDIQIDDVIDIIEPQDISGSYVVINVATNQFTVKANLSSASQTIVKFASRRRSTRSDVLEYWKSNPYLSRHVTEILPDIIISDGVELPSYYAACGLAGLDASVAPQVQFNGMTIAGVDSVRHSNFYFVDDDLDILAGSGKLILVQDTPDSIPYVRNQLTTDVSSLLTRSRHIIKSVDVFINTAVGVLKKFLRKYNIIPETLELINMALQGVINEAVNRRVPGAGGLIVGGRVVSVVRDMTALNTVIATIELILPAPLEKIRLVLNVSV